LQSKSSIECVYSQEQLGLLPPAWKRVFTLLESSGVRIEQIRDSGEAAGASNLDQLKRAFAEADYQPSIRSDDNSLILLKAADEWEAAENIATWLAADSASNKQVTIICDSSSDVLDQALVRQGLPKLGSAVDSQWRAVLQVLPLVLVNAWRLVDIHRLVELLALPISPVPRFAVRHLLDAVSREPGVGGDAWKQALSKIAEERAEIAFEKSMAWVDDGGAYIRELDEMLATARFDPGDRYI